MPRYRLRVKGVVMDAVVENEAVVQLEPPVDGAEFASARSVASWLRRLCNSRANDDVDAGGVRTVEDAGAGVEIGV